MNKLFAKNRKTSSNLTSGMVDENPSIADNTQTEANDTATTAVNKEMLGNMTSPMIPLTQKFSEVEVSSKRVLSTRNQNPLREDRDMSGFRDETKNKFSLKGNTEASEQEYSYIDELSESMRNSVNDKRFADVVIRCGKNLEHKFYAHRMVLCNRSTFFEALFSATASGTPAADAKRDKNARFCVDRPNMFPDIWLKAQEYMYTGTIKLRLENVLEILALAEDFGIRSLKLVCQKYLTQNIDTENACMLLEMSREYNAQELAEYVLNFIEKPENVKEVLQSESIAKLKLPNIISIIQRDTLHIGNADEVLVFKAVAAWAKEHDQIDAPHPQLDEALVHVRFPLMSSKQIADTVEPLKVVGQELLFEAYRHHLVKGGLPGANQRFKSRAGESAPASQ